MLNEFQLIQAGTFTYQDLGYVAWDGSVPGYKLEEHLLIRRYWVEAENRKPKPKKR